ncbi:DMT family transporter [Ruegeria sp. ANG10]|uniref:DMT family transporter n=1 Tax=Ruegeria sp. ANG10 TaxID=3042467 RepID=UPI0034530E0F
MTSAEPISQSPDRTLVGVALMLGFCLTTPLLDVSAKLASTSVPVGQITAARFVLQCALMAPFIWIMGLSLRVAKGQLMVLVFRSLLLVFATFCFIAAIRVMPLADALAIVFVAPFIVLLVGKFYLGEAVGPRRVGAALVGFVGVLFVIQPSFAAFGANVRSGNPSKLCKGSYLRSPAARAWRSVRYSGLDPNHRCGAAVGPIWIGERHVPPANIVQMSICSAILRASSSSTPRYRTVLSTLVWPSRS